MGCSCSKNRTTPTGMGVQPKATPAPQTVKPPTTAESSHTQRTQSAAVGQTQTFSLQTPDGAKRNFGSLLEARAERARSGGGAITPN